MFRRRRAAERELHFIKKQIRPHFLFNSLNTIASLTHDQPNLAEQAIENLADLFRASLQDDAIVSLQREIELTQDYIDLELLRLDDRLRVNWAIEVDHVTWHGGRFEAQRENERAVKQRELERIRENYQREWQRQQVRVEVTEPEGEKRELGDRGGAR